VQANRISICAIKPQRGISLLGGPRVGGHYHRHSQFRPFKATIDLPRQARISGNMLLQSQATSNDDPLNVAGTFVYLADPDIPIDPLHGKIGEIAIAAVDLNRSRAYRFRHF
jgi:hypothetical protein